MNVNLFPQLIGNPSQFELNSSLDSKSQWRKLAIHFIADGEPDTWPVAYSDAYTKILHRVENTYLRIISPDELLTALQDSSSRTEVIGIYVLQSLEGPLYADLAKRSEEDENCRIVSHLALLECIDLNKSPLIPLRKWPLASLTFLDQKFIIASSDNYTEQVKYELRDKIRAMGGGTSRDMIGANFLISENMITNKAYYVRKKMKHNMPIVTREFVDRCWKAFQSGKMISKNQLLSIIQQCTTPSLFDGAEFCLYKLTKESTTKVKTMLHQVGAYCTEKLSHCSQFIVFDSQTLLPELQRIIKANDISAEAVSPEWIEKCLKEGKIHPAISLTTATNLQPTAKRTTNDTTIPKLGFQVIKRSHKSQHPPGSVRVAKLIMESESQPTDQDLLAIYSPSLKLSKNDEYIFEGSTQVTSASTATNNENENPAQLVELPPSKGIVGQGNIDAATFALRISGSQEASLVTVKHHNPFNTDAYEGLVQASKLPTIKEKAKGSIHRTRT